MHRGRGEMEERMNSVDWANTSVGPVESWPQSLKVVVGILLSSRYAMWMGWGPDLTFFYNDAYRPTLGVKHEWALGSAARQVWAEIWPDIGPRAESVLRTGVATWDEGLLLFLERSGYPEETYHTFSYSPVPDDTGATAGMLCVVTEETERIIGARRLDFLRELASGLNTVQSELELFRALEQCLTGASRDFPFTLTYLFEGDSRKARLVSSTGIARETLPAPLEIDTAEAGGIWPVQDILGPEAIAIELDLPESRFGSLPTGAWDKPPRKAVLVPIAQQGQEQPAGFLVLALNPYRPFDTAFRGFVELVSSQIAAGLSSARVYAQERRRAEALAELDRAKTVFFSNVSHEFRTPLTLMLGPIEESLSEVQEPRQRERLELLHRNALRLQKLVNSLLDFSRIEAGRIQASYEPVDLSTFTAELASSFSSACERAGLSLQVDCPPLSESVYVDRDLWEKVVLNLLSNAFKFTLHGGISVRMRQLEGQVQLQIQDTGVGIPESQLPHIFERFHRVEGTLARTHEGSGIGLALVQELVRLHGGQIGVESHFGEGTTFTISLPLGKDHLPAEQLGQTKTLPATSVKSSFYVEEASRWLPEPAKPLSAAAQTPEDPEAGPDETQAPKRRIVLAEDNADMRGYIARLLKDHYQVEAVSNGQAALDAVHREMPELVLSDVMMPGLDGFGLLRELRADERTRAIPVILLSARAGEEARVQGLESGADDYLIKPFAARELIARIGSLLELVRVRREAADALHEIEMRFRLMADDAPVMIWVTEIDGWCSFLSKSWYEFTGQTPETGLGFGWLDAVSANDRPVAKQIFLAANSRHEPFRLEYRLRRKDGVMRWAMDAATPRFSAEGNFLGYIGSVVDITERKQMEETLLDADRRKDEFLAMLAHELRNPLAPIRNVLQLLRLNQKAPDQERIYDMLERQVNHMVRLVDDLLEISRITRGKIELRKERTELTSILQSSVETSRSLLEAEGHRLNVSLPAQPVFLDADAVRLAQVFTNLLNNAAKFTESGGRIDLGAVQVGNEAVITVRDSGAGIPSQMLDRIFDPFVQVETDRARTQGGLGIGLTLVRKLVEMHGGRVMAFSEGTGRGSEFVVRLPVLTQTPRLVEPKEPVAVAPSGAVRRVLVVDDNQDAADSLAMLLGFRGLELQVEKDGPSALKALDRFRPDAVILDLGMPGMDGYEVARRIRQNPEFSHVLLIALTGWGQAEDRRRSAEAGFDVHFVKPADLASLQAVLLSHS